MVIVTVIRNPNYDCSKDDENDDYKNGGDGGIND